MAGRQGGLDESKGRIGVLKNAYTCLERPRDPDGRRETEVKLD